MCMEDVRLGRKTLSMSYSIAYTSTAVKAVPVNPRRVCLRLSVNLSTSIALVSIGDPANGAIACSVSTAGGNEVFDIQRDGEITTKELWVAGVVAATLYVTETILEDQ